MLLELASQNGDDCCNAGNSDDGGLTSSDEEGDDDGPVGGETGISGGFVPGWAPEGSKKPASHNISGFGNSPTQANTVVQGKTGKSSEAFEVWRPAV